MDVAMLLRDVMMPLPMREGWGPEMEWPYPGVPVGVVAEFAGHRVARLPFFAPETVTTDHGGSYKAHDLVEAQRVLGCNILPARTLRPQDKAACERAFGALRTLLFAKLPGYTGVDVADRGADPEADATLTMSEMERLIAEFAVRVWQVRALGEHAPAWGPGEEHSPNTLLAAAMEQGGFRLQVPRPELYYELLPAHHVKIHPGRGVKISGLWYGKTCPGLRDFQGPSGRGGKHKDKWVVRADRRDRRQVFLQGTGDPPQWHVLRWNGLPPEGEVPAFSDKTAEELLALTGCKQPSLPSSGRSPRLAASRRAGATPSSALKGGTPSIPAFLPEHWFTRHFTPIDGVSAKFSRRTASLRLVQMVAGGPLGEAARFLGIGSADVTWPGGGAYGGAGRVHAGARQQPGTPGFDAALEALARELDNPATPLVNYQRRRQALRAWHIGEQDWAGIIARLPPSPGPQQSDLGDRKRQVASIYVWTRVTSGEHIFAPRPIEATRPPSPCGIAKAGGPVPGSYWTAATRAPITPA